MPYTPINPDVFVAVYSGCVSALEGGFQLNTNTDLNVYAGASAVAGAFAQAFDEEWASATLLDSLELGMIRGLCLEVFTTRVPNSILMPDKVSLDADLWRPYCRAIIAMITAGSTWFSSQAIAIPPVNPPLPPGSGETVVAVPFTYQTPSPLLLGAIHAGQILNRASLLIQTPFNGSGPQVLFGTSTNPSLYLACQGPSSPGFSVQYEDAEISLTPSADILLLTLTVPAATQGAGVLLYKLL
jgi:hypothetical protein